MSWLLGGALGALGSLASGVIGGNASKKASKKVVKGAKAQEAVLRNEQLPLLKEVFNQGQATTSDVLAQQQAAANAAARRESGLIAQDRAAQAGVYAPYQAYGQQGMDALSGLLGESPEAAQGFVDRFQGSPVYSLNYDAQLAEGQRGVENRASSMGGLNSGAVLKALQGNATDTTNRLLGQYVGYGQDQIGVGERAAAGLSGAYARNTGYGIESSNRLGQNLQGNLSAYGTNRLNTGQNYASNAGSAYSGIGTAIGNRYGAKAAGILGQGQAFGQGLAGAGQAVGQAYGQYMNPYAQNPYGQPRGYGPTNLVPNSYYQP